MVELSSEARALAGILLLTVVAIEAGGHYLTRVRGGVPLAAILMPAGFFFSSMGREATRPNRLIWLIWAGAVSLAVGALTLGIGLLTA